MLNLIAILLFTYWNNAFHAEILKGKEPPVDVQTESLVEKAAMVRDPIRLTTWQAVADSAARIFLKHGVPGAQFAVFTADSMVFYHNYGLARKSPDVVVADSTVFRLGSTSKHFAGILALLLVDEGVLDLNERLADALPEFSFDNPWEDTDPVRLKHLMEHTTGFDDTHFHEYAVNDSTILLEQGIQKARYMRRSRWKPGLISSYCNLGPPLLARVIELKTGRVFEDLVKERIFEPAGLHRMSYHLTDDNRNRLSDAHYGTGGIRTDYWHIAFRPSGSINATGRELAAWGQLLLNNGKKHDTQVLPQDVLNRISTPATSAAAMQGKPFGYAMGMERQLIKGTVILNHGGATNGHQTMLWLIPEAGLGGIIMINSDQGTALRDVNQMLLQYALRSLEEPEYRLLTEGEKKEYAGYYTAMFPRNAFARGIAQLTGRYRIYQKADTMLLKGLLDPQVQTLSGLDSLVVARPANGLVTDVLSIVRRDGRTLIDPMGLVKISAFRYWGGVAAACLVLLVLVVNVFLALGWLVSLPIAALSAKAKRLNTGYAWWPLLAVAPVLHLGLLLSGTEEFSAMLAAAEFGVNTVLIYVLSALTPMMAAAGLFNAWSGSAKSGAVKNTWRWISAVATVLIATFFVQFDLWAFRPWVDM